MSTIKRVLSQGAFWMVNKHLVKQIGIPACLLLSELVDKYDYHEAREQLVPHPKNEDNFGYFYQSMDNIEENTTLAYRAQKSAVAVLVEKGLIKTIVTGLPATTHFTIIENKIWDLLVKPLNSAENTSKHYSFDKTSKLVTYKRKPINNIDNKNIDIELSNSIIPNIDTREELSTITASASAREPETEFEPEEQDSKAEMSAKEKKWYAHQVEKFGLENNQKPFISDLTNFYYPIDEMYLPIPKSAYSAKFRAKYPPLLPEHRWRIERFEELLALNPTNQAGAQTAFEHECYQYIDWKSVRSNRGVKPIIVDEITEDYLAEMPHSNRATWLYMGLKYEFVGASSNRLKFTEVKVPVFPLSYLKQCDFARLGAYLRVASKIPKYHEVITKLIEEKKQNRKK